MTLRTEYFPAKCKLWQIEMKDCRKNVPGEFYVDSSCIDCDMCRGNAPQFFRRDDETGFSVVYKQPVTPQEIQEAQKAMNECPSESIGNDGA